MLDFLRNWTKSAQEKRQEALHAYLDDELAPVERTRFEQQLAADAELRTELQQLRFFKQQLRQMPHRRVPRNFILDPAAYGRPKREPLVQAYPILRTATVMAAFIFIFVLALNFFPSFGGVSFEEAASETVVQVVEVTVEVTRVVTETEVVTGESVEVTRVVIEEVIVEMAPEKAMPAAEEARTVEMEEAVQEAVANESDAAASVEDSDAIAEDESQQAAPVPTPLPTRTPRPKNTPTPEADFEATAVARLEAIESDDNAESQADSLRTQPTEPALRRVPLSATEIAAIILGILFILLIILTWIARRRIQT